MLEPAGTEREVTVCRTTSRLVHVIVLFTPTTTLMLFGAKFRLLLKAIPGGTVTATVPAPPVDGIDAVVLIEVEVEVLEDDVL